MRNSRRPSDRTLRNGEYMQISLNFILESIIFGVGLAMDAFSVSMANGLQDPGMSRKRMLGIAGTFAFFQFLMPMIGWACVHTIAKRFEAFQKMVPWIAFVLLVFICLHRRKNAGGGTAGTGSCSGGNTALSWGTVRTGHCDFDRCSFRRFYDRILQSRSCSCSLGPDRGDNAGDLYSRCPYRQIFRNASGGQGICSGRCDPDRHRMQDTVRRRPVRLPVTSHVLGRA